MKILEDACNLTCHLCPLYVFMTFSKRSGVRCVRLFDGKLSFAAEVLLQSAQEDISQSCKPGTLQCS